MDGMQFYQLCVWKAALKLETLGMHNSRGSVYALVKKKLGFHGNKASVLKQLVDHIENIKQNSSHF